MYSEKCNPLKVAVEAVGLPYPLPSRWATPDADLIRKYVKHAKDIVEAPGIEFTDLSEFSGAIREHIDTKFRDCWADMVAAYFAAPPGKLNRSQFAFWLTQAAGNSKEFVAKVLDVVLQEDPAEIWEFSPWLMVRINQEQWDKLAPHLADPALVERNVNFIKMKRARIEKNGVNPWIPGITL